VDVSSLCFASAQELASLLRGRALSAREVMSAHLAQIARLNPQLNAIVAKLDDDACLELADRADHRLARGERVGPLHGLPIAFKDMEAAVGFPFTKGSPIFKGFMPGEDTVIVERLRRAGAIPIGKTNVPEFGMGSHTYNRVYGTTRNPYDTRASAGGSSGGAAAALASGMLPIADGGDLGGSLRNPANFNNVVALRPTVGLVPNTPTPLPLLGFAVKGALARSASDVAYLLAVISGPDARDPGCYPSDPARFLRPLERDFAGIRVAWCPDLGGLPLDPRVRAVLDAQRPTFERLGCIVEEAAPDLADADEIFVTIRTWMNWVVNGPLLAEHRDQMKPEAIWDIEEGSRINASDIGRVMLRHAELLERVRQFQNTYEFILCAVNQVPPFEASLDWPKSIAGEPMANYLSWMKSAYWISTTCRPAASVPAGFTPDGLPVGIQIVGRYRDDFAVLQLAHAFEQATGVGRVRPKIA
jgi:amidase